MTGTLDLLNVQVHTLFDSGATHSFISETLVKRLNLPSSQLDYVLEVSNPLGNVSNVECCYKSCPVRIMGRTLPADLIPLPMKGIDIILGMDWLSKYWAKIDCHRRQVFFSIPGKDDFTFHREE